IASSSTPLDVLLVTAGLCASGSKFRYDMFGLAGRPFICVSALSFSLLTFRLVMYVTVLAMFVTGFTRKPASFISGWFSSSRDLYVFRYVKTIQSFLLFMITPGAR